MPAPLNQSQLDTLQTFVAAGDRIGYWSTLAGWGFDYALLALGVVSNDSMNGRTANEYAENQAIDAGVTLSTGDWAQIGQSVMERDFLARQTLHDTSPEVADINVQTIRNYHTAVFDEFGLPPETWTAYAPTIVAGPEGEDEIWAAILEGAAAASDTIWVNASIVYMMSQAAIDSSHPQQALAIEWLAEIVSAIPEAVGVTQPDVGPYEVEIAGGGWVIGGSMDDDEEVLGTDENDVVLGYAGFDTLIGGDGDDVIYGGSGDDRLIGGNGNDRLYGGDPLGEENYDDAADYSGASAAIVVDMSLKIGQVVDDGYGTTDSLNYIKFIYGTQFDDVYYGALTGNTLCGNAFDPLVSEDFLDSDTVDYSKLTHSVVVDFSVGLAVAGDKSDGLWEIENAIGTAYDDEMFGNEVLGDGLFGGGAKDKLSGFGGADTLVGGVGEDKLEGGSGNDILYGDDHKQVYESPSADTLIGGAGGDQFIISGDDLITDPDFDDNVGFDDGSGNIIWLSGGNRAGGDEEDTGDGRDEYSPADGFYYEDTGAGTVVYHWVEGSSHLTINLPDGSVIDVHDWENGKAGIELITTPDDDKYDESNALGSPLVLDLDGDGVELIETSNSRAYFDLDQDGFAERTGWVGPDDGLLALDVNSNGTIDDISELFGVEGNWDYDQLATELNTTGKLPSGFDKLRLLDNNSDGVIDAADSAFDDLRVWQDLNGDGVSQAGELSSLSALGIASLSLTSTQQIVGEGSNAITDFGTFTRTDTSTGDMVDVWFGYDGHATKDLTPTAIDPATANLPKLHAYGEAGSLSEAMSADAQLLSMVTDFANLTVADAAELETRVEDILLRWYGADGIDPLSRGDSVNAGWLTALEHIYGTPWRNGADSPNPNSNGGALLAEAWRDYKSTILVQLLAQTPLGQTLFPGLAFSGMAFLTLPDTLSLEDVLGNLSANAPTDSIEKLQYWHSMILALDALYPEFKELLPPPGEEEEEVDFEPIFIDAIETALAAAGIAYSYDQLRGGDLGTAGNDVLVGVGSTYDPDLDPDLRFEALLVGADGNDTYLVGSATFGPGIDIVVEGANGGTDTVKSWENYTLTANVENLTLLGTTGLNGTGNDLGNLIVGNTGGNVLTGLDGADTLEGGAGNDTLQGGDGSDSISLGTGKDRVSFANVLEAGDIVTGFTTSGTEQDTINLDALFDALNGGISSAARAGRVQLVETGTDVELRIDTAAGTGAGDGVGDVTLMVFAGMTSAAGLSIGTLSTSDIQVGTA